MIKNESRIITRSIQSTLPFADAICIEDTGSTDDTCAVITEHFKTLPIPGKLYQHPWRNFGYSRSHSYTSAQDFCRELGWNPARTYAFAMDADMNLIVNPGFNKEALTASGYQVTQRAGSLHYVNLRLMRLSDPWTCVGATHEYWSAPQGQETGRVEDDLMFIDDKNDGGCKADKFTRDLRLLTEELEEQPMNQRTHFYLAQTYKCLGDTKNSIKFYKKRIQLGGWFEEVWMSHYMIAQLYLADNQPEKAELWVQRAQKYNNYRAEALFALARYYRIQPTSQWKAMHYLREAMQIPRPKVALFLESEVYDFLMDYEYTVLQYYVNPVRLDGNKAAMRYMLKQGAPNFENVFSNLEFYTEPLPRFYKRTPLNAPQFDDYKASSPCALKLQDGTTLLNIRYVNYETTRQGAYTPRDPEGQVRTRNAYIRYNASDSVPPLPITAANLTHMDHSPPSDLTVHPTRVHGLEDVRIFEHNGKTYYTASSTEFSPQFRVVFGEYDTTTNTHRSNHVIPSPFDRYCEKNWLAVTNGPEIKFIYNWSPFQVGTLNKETYTMPITTTYTTPPYFKQLRGSANPVLYRDHLYALVHAVKYGSPRKYMHHIVKLDATNLKPLEISHAFAFEEVGIEYCLSMNIDSATEEIEFYYSHFDANPKYLKLPLSEFHFITV